MDTIGEVLLEGERSLHVASPSANTDARVLLQHCLDADHTWLIMHREHVLTSSQLNDYRELLNRRCEHEPIAYITGHKEFWSLDLLVNEDVLIPRPETELLVERALERIPIQNETRIADIATGSGAVALAIASERPKCQVVATDTSQRALDIATQNANRLGIANVSYRSGKWLEPLESDRFDLILSNPPYIATADPHLLRGDLPFEPSLALIAGSDGLDAIKEIVAQAGQYIVPNGWLLFEHGYDQQPMIRTMLENAGYKNIQGFKDYAKHPRAVEAQHW